MEIWGGILKGVTQKKNKFWKKIRKKFNDGKVIILAVISAEHSMFCEQICIIIVSWHLPFNLREGCHKSLTRPWILTEFEIHAIHLTRGLNEHKYVIPKSYSIIRQYSQL